MRRIPLINLFIFIATILNWQNCFAAKKIASNTIITKIKSNFIDVKRKNQIVYLYGNVIVEREDLSILADKMMVYYYENAEDENHQIKKSDDKKQKIKKIEAKDNVKIFNDEFVATGKYGFFDPKENNFTLEEDVVLNKGTSVANGQKFIYNLTTKKGNLVGQEQVKDFQKKQDGLENNNQPDNRVVVIINDADIKQSKQNKKKNE
jgi:lipopolysaccharide export system protein LptA